MAGNIDIPEWKPLSFSGIEQIPQLYLAAKKTVADMEEKRANAETQRRYAQNQDRKLSHDIARQTWEDQHKLDTERSAQLLPGSDFWRAAHVSAGLGNAVGQPYGLTVHEETTGGPPPESNFGKFDAKGDLEAPDNGGNLAQFLQSYGAPKSAEPAREPAPERAPLQGPTETGAPLSADPTAEALLAAPNAAAEAHGPLQGPTPAGPSLAETPDVQPEASAASVQSTADSFNVDEATSARVPPTTRRLFASTIAGQRFEAPKEGPTAVFAEPEYNAMVDKLVADGKFKTDAEAVKFVEGVRKADIGEQGKNTRAGNRLRFQEGHTLTAEDIKALKEEGFDVSRENSKGRDQAIVTAAGIRAAEGTGGGVQADPKMLAALNSRLTQIRGLTAWTQLAQQEQQLYALEQDVARGAQPLQTNEAKVIMARILRGRVSNEEMHQLYDNLGGASDMFNRFVENTLGGRPTDEQLRQIRAAVVPLLEGHKMMVKRAQQVARSGLDSRTFPALPGEAQAGYDMVNDELGLPHDPLDPNAGQAPAPAPRGAAPRRATARPGVHNEAVDWARAHRGDPRATVILKANGINE